MENVQMYITDDGTPSIPTLGKRSHFETLFEVLIPDDVIENLKSKEKSNRLKIKKQQVLDAYRKGESAKDSPQIEELIKEFESLDRSEFSTLINESKTIKTFTKGMEYSDDFEAKQEKLLSDPNSITWNPDAVEKLYDVKEQVENGEISMVATCDIRVGKIIYKGEPFSSYNLPASAGRFGLWTQFILKQKGSVEFMAMLHPRDMIERDVGFIMNKKIQRNHFNTGPDEKAALYYKGEFFNHSCVSNAAQYIDPNTRVMTILALDNIKAGEEVTISYKNECTLIDNTQVRQKILLDAEDFLCKCQACINVNSETPLDRTIELYSKYKTRTITFNNFFCTWCGIKGKESEEMKWCEECKIPRYCGKKCKKKHWKKYHKKQCKKWKSYNFTQ